MQKVNKMFICLGMLFFFLSFPIQGEAAAAFKDTPKDHWASKEIEFLSSKEIITGFKDGTFKPESMVTRGQAAIIFVRALNLNVENRPNPGFKDLSPKHSAYKSVAVLVDEKIYPKGANYNPDKTLTREEMARMLANALTLKGQKTVVFSDVANSYWAQPYISLLAENGVTAGYSNGTFQPKGPVTRAQFSVFLSRGLDDRFKIKPLTSKKEPVPMKDILFGMTYQEVKDKETRKLHFDYYSELETSYQEYTTEKYGENSHLMYFFDNGQLNTVLYNFNPEKQSYTAEQLKNMHDALQVKASAEFGSLYSYNEEVTDRVIEYSSMWKVNNYEILLLVTQRGGETFVTLTYHLPKYKSAAEKSKEKQMSSLIKQVVQYEQHISK